MPTQTFFLRFLRFITLKIVQLQHSEIRICRGFLVGGKKTMWYFYDGDDEMDFEEEEDPDPDPDPLTHNSSFQLQQKWKAQYQPYDNQRWLPTRPCDLQPVNPTSLQPSMLVKSPSRSVPSGSPSTTPPTSFSREPPSLLLPENLENSDLVYPLLRRTRRVYRPFVNPSSYPPSPPRLPSPNQLRHPSDVKTRKAPSLPPLPPSN